MVHRKQVRKKKPKDLVVLAEEEVPAGRVRRGGDPGGGSVTRTALAPLPNYMRATSCSGAKAGHASRSDAATAPPTKREKVGAPPRAGRATCSSTMKKRPVVAAGGPAHVCSYAYCSLKGRVHASVAPLSTFLPSRRRLIKTQQSMKLKGASPFRKPNNNGGGGDGYFVEIHAGAGAPVALDVSCSGLSTEEMLRRMERVMFDRLSCGDDDAKNKSKDSGASGSCGSSVVISDGSLELLGSTKNSGRKDNGPLVAVVDHEDEDDCFGACKSDISDEFNFEHQGYIPEVCGNNAPKESSSDGISGALSGISSEDVSSDSADALSTQTKQLCISGRRRTSEEDGKQMRPFKPKAPNFLLVETGPEAEKVDLRHQAVNDRRGAEEWMVDYALRKAVKKFARAQKRKVEILVQAFETVLPTVNASEKEPVQHDDDKTSFTLSRPSQACS